MIISHSRKFIFVHLHKTAGTSISNALVPYLSNEDIVIDGGANASSPNETPILQLDKHASARLICKTVGDNVWRTYFKFSFVRHPFDRLVSLYEFLNRVRRNNAPRQRWRPAMLRRWQATEVKPNMNQQPWCWAGMQALLSSKSFSDFIRSDRLAESQGGRPQSEMLSDANGNLLVDFVGKVEQIADDWDVLLSKLGIQTELPHNNRSKRRFKNVLRYWNDEDLNFALDRYQADFQMFGYSDLSYRRN